MKKMYSRPAIDVLNVEDELLTVRGSGEQLENVFNIEFVFPDLDA